MPYYLSHVARLRGSSIQLVGLQPTVIASRAPHLLLEQRIVDVHRPSTIQQQSLAWGPQASLTLRPKYVSYLVSRCDQNMFQNAQRAARGRPFAGLRGSSLQSLGTPGNRPGNVWQPYNILCTPRAPSRDFKSSNRRFASNGGSDNVRHDNIFLAPRLAGKGLPGLSIRNSYPRVALTRALRARRARPPEVAAQRA